MVRMVSVVSIRAHSLGQGSAIVFNDCLDNGEEDQRSLHAGLPPANPDTVKYAINGWIRSDRISHMGAL